MNAKTESDGISELGLGRIQVDCITVLKACNLEIGRLLFFKLENIAYPVFFVYAQQ